MPYSRCQHENPTGAKFCGQCGVRLESDCPVCQAVNPPENKFCTQCGSLLLGTVSTAKQLSPELYTPAHLAEKIATSKAALEGERKQVTVLFADLRGSMELVAEQDPEEARALLDAVLGRMMDAVHRYEGTVNQVMGDGLMALFGAPVANEDHAIRACYAALHMQRAIGEYAEETRRSRGVSIQIRVGLNSGEVVVRSILSDLHMDYSAVGQTTHLAARMEQLATPGTVMMTKHTWRLVEGHVAARPLGPMKVRGLEKPIEAFEVTGAVDAHSRLHASPGRPLTRFVGRRAELDQLQQALERAREGPGQMVTVVGGPGVGKSRLVLEFARSSSSAGFSTLETGAVSYRATTPYFPIIRLLGTHFQIPGRGDQRAFVEVLKQRLVALDPALESAMPALLTLFDIAVDEPQWLALDPGLRRRRILDAVTRILLAESRKHPLLLILEDLQWIDSETQAVLDCLADSLPAARVLLLMTHRPEYVHTWASKISFVRLRIDPLPPEGAHQLLDALLGPSPQLQPLKRLLIDRTEGNPFFLEESVRSLVETEALDGEHGAYRLVRPLAAVRVPATVEAVLGARIDRLPPEDKRLLQSAAVIGRDFPFALLRAITNESEDDLTRTLARLQAAEFLYETRVFPDPEYTFSHALTHEVTYRALLHGPRRSLHAEIVAAIERLYPERVADEVERLAQHATRAELWSKAALYHRQAGRKAVARSASREAIASFEQALAALEHLGEEHEALEQAIDVRFDLQSALVPLGDLNRMLTVLHEAEVLAKKLEDSRRLGYVTAAMSHCFWWTGEPERSAEFGHRALAIAADLQDLTLQVVTSLRLVQAYFAMGDYPRVIEWGRRSLDTLIGDLEHQPLGLPALPSVTIRAFVGRSLAALGEFEVGAATVEDSVRLAQDIGHPYSLILAYWGAGDTYVMRGDLLKAVAILERGLELCRRGDFTLMFPIVARILGEAYALAGRHAEALGYVQRAVDELEVLRYLPALPTAYAGLGEAQLLSGRLAEARQSVQMAVDLSRRHGQRGTLAVALRILGDIHATAGLRDVDEGSRAYFEALTLAEKLGMRPLAGRCHLGLGKLWARDRRDPEARRHLAAATTLFRAMGITLWRDDADAELLALPSEID